MSSYDIPFNKAYLSGNELKYISKAVESLHISGNGLFTKKCQRFFEERYGFRKALLTSSCTDALEMAAILADIKEGDEVIMPSFTFVSTANAFALRGARIVFADISPDYPNIDPEQIEQLVTHRTKAIVVVHYAGVACDMDSIMNIARIYRLLVIEDAAHAIDSFYKSRPLGSIGHMATFSFHETKNITCGEGGMLVINDKRFEKRAEIIWEKGTNRAAFWRGEVNKYGWVDIGSSFLPSEMNAAFLLAQLENLDKIQDRRKTLWHYYAQSLMPLCNDRLIRIPDIPDYATKNGHLFCLITPNEKTRDALLQHLKQKNIYAVFHYLPLHNSPYFEKNAKSKKLTNTEKISRQLIRLPLFFELSNGEQQKIVSEVKSFFKRTPSH